MVKRLLRKPKLALQSFMLNTLADSLMWRALISQVEGVNSDIEEINKELYFHNRDFETMYDELVAVQVDVALLNGMEELEEE